MPEVLPTRAAVKAVKRTIQESVNGIVQIKDSYLNEAIARGMHQRTHASLCAFLDKATTETPPIRFDRHAFIARLSELDDEGSAESVNSILEGARIHVEIFKRPEIRQQSHLYSDISYDVSVNVEGVAPETLDTPLRFVLPDFTRNGLEPYRIDSASTYRLDDGYAITRGRHGRQLMTAKLINGRWQGGLFVYGAAHIADDSRCLKSVQLSLARAILPVVTSGFHCVIFRPDRYDYGAWRVELRAGPAIKRELGSSSLAFKLPNLPKRIFHIRSPYLYDHGWGKCVDGAFQADLHTNGIPEDENPTTLHIVKQALLSNVNAILKMD